MAQFPETSRHPGAASGTTGMLESPDLPLIVTGVLTCVPAALARADNLAPPPGPRAQWPKPDACPPQPWRLETEGRLQG